MGSLGDRRAWARPSQRVRRPPRRRVAVVVLLVGLLVPALLTSGVAVAATPDAPVAAAVPVGSHASPPGTVPASTSSSSQCAAASAGWATFDAQYPAPNVAASLQSPCTLQHDVPSLYFVSNSPESGSKVEVNLVLPTNGSHPASAMSAFWVGMWLSGVSCSYNGASYLTVELLPPYVTQAGAGGSPFWTVRAPVWDLVPAGSCDPQCTNDTAFFTISGRPYCEDDVVVSGIGSLGGAAGELSPGDHLTIVLSGSAGGVAPLSVVINDTSHPSHDLAWTYSGFDLLANGTALFPFYSTASAANGGWTGGLDVGFGWQNCPLPLAGTSFATSCNSYDGPLVNATGSPAVDSITSWNATSHAYSSRYAWVATQSSSGACSGSAGAAPCADFTTYGGTGAYPLFQVQARLGIAWYTYGGASPYEKSDFGGAASEFPANGSLSALEDPTAVSNVTTAIGANDVSFRVRASDPNGVGGVSVTSYWCTTNSTREALSYPATLSTSPFNTSLDGNWTVNVPTGAAGMTGPFFYAVAARSESGLATTPLLGKLTLTSGTGGSCGAARPKAPGLSSQDILPVGGGFLLSWNESNASGVSNFTVDATPTLGGPTVDFFVGNATSARVDGLQGNASYDVSVVATNPAGLSTPSSPLPSVRTVQTLVGRATTFTASTGWINATTLRVFSNATGGQPAYTFTFSFGDGTNESIFTSSAEASAVHEYNDNFSGDAVVTVAISDSLGDQSTAPTIVVPVRGTPLGLTPTMMGGDTIVRVSWSPPPLPPVNASAFNVTSYVVLWTTNASAAAYLGEGWPSNASIPSVSWGVTGPGTRGFTILAPDGTEVFAQAFAVNKYGDGLLPAESSPGVEPYLTATAEAFAAGPMGLSPGVGGPAPFLENFTTPFTTGTETSLVSAVYRFTGGASVVATIEGNNGSFWANASYVFDSPGLINVYLYAINSLSAEVVVPATVLVTAGAGPVVSILVAPTPVWVNASVTFTASASGGSGHYNYSWSLGDGTTATGENTTYSYTAAGTYIVAVTVTDTEYGGVSVATVPVTVLSVPTVEIAVTANGSAGTYRLAAIVSGGYGNLSYTWIFDDGTQGTGAVVSHTWTAPGTYTVTLEATDGYGHSATSTTIIVVGASTTVLSTASGGYAPWVVYALLGAIVLLAVVLLVQRSRGGRASSETTGEPLYGDPEGPGADAPTSETAYEEESPRGT
jgi:PKD repeat protein